MKKSMMLLSLSMILLSMTSCDNKYSLKLDEEKPDNDEIVYTLENNGEIQKLFENDNFRFSYRETTDVIEVFDKRNNYSWKTGIDMEKNTEYCNIYEGDRAGKQKCVKENPLVESGMVDAYLAMANSLFTVNLYKTSGSNFIVNKLPTSLDGVSSNLYKVVNEDNHYKFVVDYNEVGVDIKIKADIYFTNEGYEIKILNQNITGVDSKNIKNIMITPFLGASGGIQGVYDGRRGYNIEDKPWDNGYVFVPDGAGSLINLNKVDMQGITKYLGYVYGIDPSHSVSYESSKYDRMTIKDAKLPLFGITKTDINAAFVGYATSGNEYMAINMSPYNSTDNVKYAWAYPTFEYNFEYTQVYNKAGQGYSKIADDRNQYTLDIRYDFLANDDANYVGMAKSYRNYLIRNNELTIKDDSNENIPIRLDFIMSDTEEALVGSNAVVTTKVNELEDILIDIHDNLNIDNAVVSLQGWQEEGKSTQNPTKANFTNKIGTASQFDKLIKNMANYNYDVSFAENYYLINNEQMPYLNNASKHINGYYNKFYNYQLQYMIEYGFAKANKSYEFVKKQHKALSSKLNYDNATLYGIGAGLVSNELDMNRTLAKKYIVEAYKYLKDENIKINSITPNSYLWKYVDRYFDIDAFDSALLIENDTVPFLQLVLNNTMEMYSTYCNYSFYDDKSICKMIDYNIYPSFVLTNDSAYYLLTTDSWLNFSTQYDVYKELIEDVYTKVNGALKHVKNANWINRVKENNVVTNYYDNNKAIVINYNNYDVVVNNIAVKALSYEVIDYEK